MASGHRHWTIRLNRLTALPALRRSQRRALRKLLGRRWGLEWRLLGNTRGGIHEDALNRLVLKRARKVGHVAARLAEVRRG